MKIFKPFIYLACLIWLSSCSSSPSQDPQKFSQIDIGNYKIGTPYIINDQKYFPKIDTKYDQIGYASWYGKEFHNKKTANGAIFSKDKLTAAHKTLPLPSIVEVTNLQNHKKIKVIINDRGPYVNDRIIDLSEKAAALIGSKKQGIAKVRVRYLKEETEILLSGGNPFEKIQPKQNRHLAKIHHNENQNISKEQNHPKINNFPAYIQVGAFSIEKNAEKTMQILLEKDIKSTYIKHENNKHKIKIGPIDSQDQLDEIFNKLHFLNLHNFIITHIK